MPRRDRPRRPARARPFRDPKPVILVVCEGRRTEPDYLHGFRKHCKNPRVRIEFSQEHGQPMGLVRWAVRRKSQAEREARAGDDDNLLYDAVWCVFDRDEHQHFHDAIALATKHDIKLAVSNPSFELWLLLHFRDSPGMNPRHRVKELLTKHLPDYDKTVKFADHEPGYSDAVARARRLNEAQIKSGTPGGNPSTTVCELTESIRS